MKKLLFRLAWRNVFRQRKKSALAILAVAACCFSLNLFEGYIQGAEVIFEDSYSRRVMFGDLLVRRAGVHHTASTDPADALAPPEQAFVEEFLAGAPELAERVRFLVLNGTLGQAESQAVFTGLAYDVTAGQAMRRPSWEWNTLAGRPLAKEEQEAVLIGQGLGKLLGCEREGQEAFITGRGGYTPTERPFRCRFPKLQLAGVTMAGQANALRVEVGGIVDAMFRELDLRYVQMPLRLAQRLLDTHDISFYALRLRAGADQAAFLARFREAAGARGLPLVAHSWKDDELGDFYQRTMNFLHLFRDFMIAVILGVALLSIFNTFFRNVQERTREIGTLRTLGFRVREVRALFLLEAFFLASLGVLIGGSAAALAGALLNRSLLLYRIGLLTQPIPFLVEQNTGTFAWTVAVALLVALLGAGIPLRAAGRRKISEALAHG